MKALTAVCAALGIAGALAPRFGDDGFVLVLGGDIDGMLSPCGCAEPMIGGVRRKAAATRMLTVGREHAVIENSGLLGGSKRQDELKAQALAEVLNLLDADAVNVGPGDLRAGRGVLLSLSALVPGRLVSGSLEPDATSEIVAHRVAGPFLVGGVSTLPSEMAATLGQRPVAPEVAVSRLVEAATLQGKEPLLMLQGNRADAIRIAQAHPALRLVLYRSSGSPPSQLEFVGTTALATPGEMGKHILRVVWRDRGFHDYVPVQLGPSYPNDPDASRIYSRYLQRVTDEALLDKVPRSTTEPFSGSARCAPCHSKAHRSWSKTAHADALKTLEDDGHGRDPECVGCHVVGLSSSLGFKTRQATPDLASVGCESCHGPGAAHAANSSVPMGRVGEASCAPCHTAAHSPRFTFGEYWPRIAH